MNIEERLENLVRVAEYLMKTTEKNTEDIGRLARHMDRLQSIQLAQSRDIARLTDFLVQRD